MWPAVRRAVDLVLGLQHAGGEIALGAGRGRPAGRRRAADRLREHPPGLRCAVALAELPDEPQPDWELAADQLGHAVARHPEAFADKGRFSMDWYYPVLGGAVRGEDAAAPARRRRGTTFVVPGLGVRCVDDQPWVTGAETCELVLALDACGMRDRALEAVREHAAPAPRGRLLLDRLAFADQAPLPAGADDAGPRPR